ncbi:MAG: glycosyltransferase family 4 protein [Caldilineaceae bacterium]
MTRRVAYIGIKGLPSKAGVDRVVEAIVQHIDKTHYQPVVYCSSKLVPKEAQLPGIELVRMPTLPGKHLNALSLFLFAALHCLFWNNVAFVHLHNVEASFVLPLLRLRYKVITTSHGQAQERDKWGRLAKLLLRCTEYPFIHLSTSVTSVSEPLAKAYQQQYHKTVHYVPNGVDPNEVVDCEAALAILQEHQIKPGKFILFAAGRIMATKGCHLLLEAFRTIDEEIQLVVVGDMSHAPAYEQQLRQLADERVHFIPFIAAKGTLLGLVRLCQLFVFPSTVEGMSMMLLEVTSMGVPTICSDIPENVAILPPQTLFFASENVADLCAKVRWALGHQEQMQASAKAIQQWVQENYRWCTIINQYSSLYSTLEGSAKEGELS